MVFFLVERLIGTVAKVQPLTLAERHKLLVQDATWRRQGKGSLALAYRPVAREHYAVLESDQLAAKVSAGAARGQQEDVDLLSSMVGGQVRPRTLSLH